MRIDRAIVKLWRWWTTPRATERDEAFRERSIRITAGIVVIFTCLSFLSTVLVFRDSWSLISFPTLHVIGLIGFLASAIAVSRRHVFVSGWILASTISIGSGGIVLLARQAESQSTFMFAIPVFMMAIVVAALVLPSNQILLLCNFNLVVYLGAQFFIPVGDKPLLALGVIEQAVSVYLLFLFVGALLRQLLIEFDARLEEMHKSINAAESAKEQAEADRARAEEADRAKSQFLANMSHELRTPLNAIIGYSDAMLAGMAGRFTEQQRKLLGHIQYNSRRLLSLINDILDLSKIEAGSLEVHWAPMEPAKVVQETVEGLRNLADEKGIGLEVCVDDSVPEIVMSDARRVEQVVVNLLSNAIKFTEKGGVKVAVSSMAEDTWQMTVRDTGIGIPEDSLQIIFEPFRQLDGTPRRKYRGTGLGLSITKHLVETLGGTIEVASELGVGSSFTVVLPRLHEKASQE